MFVGAVLCLIARAVLPKAYSQGAASVGLKPPVGLNIDITEQALVNLAAYMRIADAAGQDSKGWPTSDFSLILDNRPIFAWDPKIRNIDPLQYTPDVSGAYRLTFSGQAVVSGATKSSYDRSTNTTVVDYEIPRPVNGAGNLVKIRFLLTRRTYDDAPQTGVTNIRLVRRENEKATRQVFTDLWLDSIRKYPWAVLRCMEAMKTNEYGVRGSADAYPHLLQWSSERRLPGTGPLYSNVSPGVHGVLSWEDLVILAQITRKDLWINIPVNASDEYVDRLAALFRYGNAATGNTGIPTEVNLYVEYSNELWHDLFAQGKWNAQAAQDEVARKASDLNYDGRGTPQKWRFRRIAKRTVEIGRKFRTAFSDNSGRIRPVLNNHLVEFDFDILRYIEVNYGRPASVLYGIAQQGYYTSADSKSPREILEGERAASDKNRQRYMLSRMLASYFGLHSLAYEGGPDETGPGDDPKNPAEFDPNLPNKFAAAREPAMKDVIFHDLMDNWYSSGGELYVAYSQAGRYSFWGMYGLTEDLANLSTGKWMGYVAVMSAPLPAVTAGYALPAQVGATVEIESGIPVSGKPHEPGPAPVEMFLLRAPASGTYSFAVHGKSLGTESRLRLMLDDSRVGTVQLTSGHETADGVKVNLDSGIHALFVFLDGTQSAVFPRADHLTATTVAIQ